ncbi:MAG: DUF4397 domain-containing protein [Burkholderiales bacterium]|nr:DUF4397 domain-containing protein [Burkholderiales bacterium]
MPVFAHLSRRAVLAFSLAAIASLAGCAKGLDDEARVRFANVTAAGISLDVYRDSNEVFDSAAAGSITDYKDVEHASNTWSLRTDGASSLLASATLSLASKTHYTMLGYGSEGNLQLQLLEETNSTPSSGYAKLRVFNAAPDAGTLDVFVSDDAQDLSSASTTVSSAAYGSATSFVTIASGNQRLRVTASGDRSDLRLDLRQVTLSSQSIVTLVIAPGRGGVLVDALLLPEQSTASFLANTQARMRVANGLSANTSAALTWNGSTVTSSQRAPSVGSYTLVNAGSATLEVGVGGATADTSARTLSAGADYTVLLTGTSQAAAVNLITDDNRLPTSSTKSKIRLVNGLTGLSDTLSLSVDYEAVATGTQSGAASGYATITPPSNGRIEIDAPTLSTPIYLNTDFTLSTQAVYSVFVLGDAGSPGTVIRKDR